MIRVLIFALLVILGSCDFCQANSYGSYGGFRPLRGAASIVANGVRRRHDRRVARREDRQARWSAAFHGGSAGSYGSAGSTSYEAAPVVEDCPDCPVEAHIEFSAAPVADCPSGNCPRRGFILGGNRRSPFWN